MPEEKPILVNSEAHRKMWQEEEQLKDAVYAAIDETLARNTAAVLRERNYVESGAYEDQDAFTAYSTLTGAERKDRKSRQEFASLLKKPYFAHMEINGDTTCHQYFLSDSADLDRVISTGSNRFIVPFKQSSDAPMLTALFHQYQMREGSPFTVSVHSDRLNGSIATAYSCTLIRDVEVINRNLENVVQLIPKMDDELSSITADELLALRLDENRANAKLRNIISTLQLQQFEVIRADEKESFIVQGCAGSGKTQCLIHRLFFLRDLLGEHGWNRVLLITPTQLFRNYSAELMRRYHLSTVNNHSLAALYRSSLEAFDQRFRGRQYKFEATEEYLPDEYLSKVYADSHMEIIEQEIRRSLRAHIEEGCNLVGMTCPEDWCTIDFVARLVDQIDKAMIAFDDRAQSLLKNAAYSEHLNALADAEKRLASLTIRQQTLSSTKDDLELQRKRFDSLTIEMESAEKECKLYRQQWQKTQERYESAYLNSVYELDKESVPTQVNIAQYSRFFYKFCTIAFSEGKRYRHYEEEQLFLNEIVELAHQDLTDFTNNQPPKTWLHRWNEKRNQNVNRANAVQGEIDSTLEAMEAHEKWLQDYSNQSDSIENQKKTFRSALEKSRYYLSRIESSVFEQEVWNALVPLKEEYNIPTLEVEQLDANRQKQTRILYKADLLFYLQIYQLLRKTDVLPRYSLICVDEGQDLHRADYDMLRRLYPNAVLNVFGDTAQALHEACGITDWRKDTGLNTVYTLNRNYRNTPAIVEFCNTHFSANMDSLGSVRNEQIPQVITSASEMMECMQTKECVCIVKNRDCFKALCLALNMGEAEFDYLDTNSDQETQGKMHCYSVFAAKGLEFPRVAVFAHKMNKNQKVVACTRAMEQLAYWDNEGGRE